MHTLGAVSHLGVSSVYKVLSVTTSVLEKTQACSDSTTDPASIQSKLAFGTEP